VQFIIFLCNYDLPSPSPASPAFRILTLCQVVYHAATELLRRQGGTGAPLFLPPRLRRAREPCAAEPPLCLAQALTDTLRPRRAWFPAGPHALPYDASRDRPSRISTPGHPQHREHVLGLQHASQSRRDSPAAEKGTAPSAIGKLSLQSLGKHPL